VKKSSVPFRQGNIAAGGSNNEPILRQGDQILVEVISFGPMGASVEIVGLGHNSDAMIEEDEPALGNGIILQKEIHYFRQARDNVDVVKGEILPAFVDRVRDDGKVDVSLRKPGGKSKAKDAAKMILNRLTKSPEGHLPIGDKSDPNVIAAEFPGLSKGTFKKAVAALYKQGLVRPGPDSISLMRKERKRT
jgi:hypothetical protein